MFDPRDLPLPVNGVQEFDEVFVGFLGRLLLYAMPDSRIKNDASEIFEGRKHSGFEFLFRCASVDDVEVARDEECGLLNFGARQLWREFPASRGVSIVVDAPAESCSFELACVVVQVFFAEPGG